MALLQSENLIRMECICRHFMDNLHQPNASFLPPIVCFKLFILPRHNQLYPSLYLLNILHISNHLSQQKSIPASNKTNRKIQNPIRKSL